MPPLKYKGDTNLCWTYSTTSCAEALYFIKTGEHILVDITSMIESAKDTMLPDGTNLPESGFEVMANGAICQQGCPPKGKEEFFFLVEVKKLLGEQEMKQALDFGPIC
ncbi:hypothetical protein ACFX2J_014323 [Malus domestica]